MRGNAWQVANRAGMLHQMPPFLGALRTMEGPGAVGLADSFVVVTLDGAAQELCLRLHRPTLCVADDWNTTGLGAVPELCMRSVLAAEHLVSALHGLHRALCRSR